MDGSVLKCSIYSLDRQNLFTGITATDIKIVSCDSKGYKDFSFFSDEDPDPYKDGNGLIVNKLLDLALCWYSCCAIAQALLAKSSKDSLVQYVSSIFQWLAEDVCERL